MYKMSSSCQIKNLSSLYNEYFPLPYEGFFLDVGAYDGYEWSNTWGLAEAGWGGICIEPFPKYAKKCDENHEKAGHHEIMTVESAVGDINGSINMFLDPTGCSHTIDEETSVRSPWGFTYSGEKLQVSCFTLNKIVELYCPGKVIDVLNIDVEGAELKVLDGFSIHKYKPFMIIIETHEGQAGKDYHAKEIDLLLTYHKYTKLQSDGLNSIFIAL